MPRQRDRRTAVEPPRRSPRQAGETRRNHARRTNKEQLDRRIEIDSTVIEYVFDRDGFYESMADRLMEQIPWRGRLGGNHWLCKQLNDTAEILDPETYRKLVGKRTRQGLIALGMPEYMASVIGAGAGFGIKVAMGKTPLGNISKVLRILIPLVCPDIGKCPARGKVFDTYMSPLLTRTLKDIAEGGSSVREANQG